MRAIWTRHKVADIGAIIGLLIAVVLVTTLASTVINQSENARATSMADRMPGVDLVASRDDNTPYASNAAPIFAMFPLFWAIIGIAIIAGAVLVYSKGI